MRSYRLLGEGYEASSIALPVDDPLQLPPATAGYGSRLMALVGKRSGVIGVQGGFGMARR